jgi:hypothetical protein
MVPNAKEALGLAPESLETRFQTRTIPDSRNPESAQRFHDGARQKRDELTDKLALIADWRDQLQVEIRRSELLLELGLLDEQRLHALTRRVRFFSDACNALADTLGGRE